MVAAGSIRPLVIAGNGYWLPERSTASYTYIQASTEWAHGEVESPVLAANAYSVSDSPPMKGCKEAVS